jgi:hypothetical protein
VLAASHPSRAQVKEKLSISVVREYLEGSGCICTTEEHDLYFRGESSGLF